MLTHAVIAEGVMGKKMATIPGVRHSKNEVAIETLEIAHAGLRK